MARYLVVAHQTASSPELLARLNGLADKDPTAEFMLLVPATRIPHLLASVEGEAEEIARRAADRANVELEAAGIRVVGAEVGDESPLLAIQDHLREHADQYVAIVISTLPLGVSRWLGLDLPHQAERKFTLPVIHVVSQPTKEPAAP